MISCSNEERSQERERIHKAIEVFQAQGGEITVVPTFASAYYDKPVSVSVLDTEDRTTVVQPEEINSGTSPTFTSNADQPISEGHR